LSDRVARMAERSSARYPAHQVRQIAVEAGRDPRTVTSALDGRASALATASVYAAIRRLGITIERAHVEEK
jgi:hypothetical protein